MAMDISLNAETEIRSGLTERILIVLIIISIYFEANLPFIGSASTPFVLFTLTLAYLLARRLNTFIRMFSGKFFIASMVFALVCVFMETMHPSARYDIIFRYVNMALGIFCIAILCRDRFSIDLAMMTFIIASSVQSVIMISELSGILHTSTAVGLYDATRARIIAAEELVLKGNLNEISYFSGIVAMIGIVWIYYEKSRLRRFLLVLLTLPSILGVFFPASRTGALIFFIATLVFIIKSGINMRKWLVPLSLLCIVLFFAVPAVVWERLASMVRISELQEVDSRSRILAGIVNNVHQFWLTGIGSGNYWEGWAVSSGITNRFTTDEAMAAHNAFLQVWIYWGLPGLTAFLFLIWVFYSAVDKKIKGDRQKSALYVFVLMIPVIFLFYHSFYHKSFSIGLGMVLGARFWQISGLNNNSLKADESK
ncbi:MAG: O-antigen ligase domain-containing protein [Bacteroidetes bacterium]|nr:MAG: O-antigen ligase domain-containing protein [Bacteroidota bacterium]